MILGVHSDPDVSAAAASSHAKEFNIRFPILLDHQRVLAAACGARIMPTAVAIRSDGQIVYRGRVDNPSGPCTLDSTTVVDDGVADALWAAADRIGSSSAAVTRSRTWRQTNW